MTPKALSREKTCKICSKKFTGNGIKYCSYECAYQAIKNKANKKMENNQLNNNLMESKPRLFPARYNLHYQVAKELFNVCPFCGCDVNVFTVPEARYGESNNFSWNLECKNMGCIFKQPEDKGIKIKDVIYDNTYKNFSDERIEKTKKFTKNYIKYDLSGKGYFSQQDRSYFLEGKMCTIPHANPTNKCNIWLGGVVHRRLHPIEAERLHNLPDNYTNAPGVTDTRRISLVGNAWVVDVVAHILSFIPKV